MTENLKSNLQLLKFMQLHEKWSKWLGIGQETIPKNTIWHQCIDMIDNHFAFLGLNQAGLISAEKNRKEYQQLFCSNRSLFGLVWDGYVAFQCTAIRKLTDEREDSHSIVELVNKLKGNTHIITREVFVCSMGYPYKYEEDLEEHDKAIMQRLLNSTDGVVWSERPKAKSSKERHEIFDRISKCKKRNPNDKIHKDYWENLEKKLSIPEIKEIRKFTDKFIAHAGNNKSVDTLSEEEKKISIKKIEVCHKALLSAFHQVAIDFWFTHLDTMGMENIAYLMEKPFCTEDTQIAVLNFLEEKETEYTQWITN